jgi:hypothetical protein
MVAEMVCITASQRRNPVAVQALSVLRVRLRWSSRHACISADPPSPCARAGSSQGPRAASTTPRPAYSSLASARMSSACACMHVQLRAVLSSFVLRRRGSCPSVAFENCILRAAGPLAETF